MYIRFQRKIQFIYVIQRHRIHLIVHCLYIVFGLYADSTKIGEMFYFVFFVTNFFALGFGFWLAMRHGEYLREHPLIMQTANDGTTETMIEAAFNVPEDADTESPSLQETLPQPILAQNENDDASQISAQDDLKTVIMADDAITDRAELDETLVHEPEEIAMDSAEMPTDMPVIEMSAVEMPSAGMIEQVIGMVENVPDDDLQNIVSQLQEIRGVISNTDNRCYVFEDAESFLILNDEKYVTTAICRPVVGRKK